MAQVWKRPGPPDESMRVRVQFRAEGKDWFMQNESLFIKLLILPSPSATQTLSPLGLLLRPCINHIPDELQMKVDSQINTILNNNLIVFETSEKALLIYIA